MIDYHLIDVVRADLTARFDEPEPDIIEAIDCASLLAGYAASLAARYDGRRWELKAVFDHRGMTQRLTRVLHMLDPEVVGGTIAENIAVQNLALANDLVVEFPWACHDAGHA